MVRISFLLFLSLLGHLGYGQQDTLVLEDYVKILVSTDTEGKVTALTSLSNEKEVGFFLDKADRDGKIRICNNEELMGWVNGRLVFSIDGCDLFDPSYFFDFSLSDTVFVSFSTSKFENFRCERVVLGEFVLVKEEGPEPRVVRDYFREFNIIAIATLIFSLALFAVKHPARLSFFINKTYSLKASSYQFINTNFFGSPNLIMMVILSFSIAFELIYIGYYSDSFQYERKLGGFIVNWFVVSIWIMSFFLIKRVLIHLVANLFKMRRLRDWQLFDLVNFTGYFSLILFIIILWDFIIKSPNDSWINSYFSAYFLIVLILFELWFVLKFVTNSSYRKLLIISYLCATEVIPSIFFIEWFFK